ncbi:MAG: hypothetical protein Kow00105_05430 [Phycisphaeraceae bacterium]
MLTCKETARLISDGLNRKLSLWQRLNLWMHLMMCGACSAYRRQVENLNRIIRKRFADQVDESSMASRTSCPDEAKRRITESLRDHLG